jgi:magnesium chelatase subunit D
VTEREEALTEIAPDAVWRDAVIATALFAVDPDGLGGMVLRAGFGPHRDQVCAWVTDAFEGRGAIVRVPLHITEERLLGGLSLADTLREGRVMVERGVLSRAHGGVLVVAMAERLGAHVTAHLCGALDRGELSLERDGIAATVACRVGVVALDEGIDDERAPSALRDRLAFHIDLSALRSTARACDAPNAADIESARALLPRVEIDEEVVNALCAAARAIGIVSLRGPVLAAAAARAHAALEGRTHVEEADAVVASRLVLGSRATRVPPSETDASETDEAPPPPSQNDPAVPEKPERDETMDAPPIPSEPLGALDEVVLEAAKSAIPPGLLDALVVEAALRASPRSAGRAGATRASALGGRPAGTRPAPTPTGQRLNVVETLRAAAPWQVLRRRERKQQSLLDTRRLEIRASDFRVVRFNQRTETSVIFAVDASGSAALQRLAEAKGAVEQVLADCYARRDHVALIAFRGTTATLLLSPTRSLTRVRRSLADLAGGGTTPLAAGIDAALSLALDERKRGRTPLVVLMTDGRGNVAKTSGGSDDGRASPAAISDAIASARALRLAGVRSLFLDTAPRPRDQARLLATEMGARYLPLPHLDAVGISRNVQALAGGAK